MGTADLYKERRHECLEELRGTALLDHAGRVRRSRACAAGPFDRLSS
jgi:hypothetical protein